ncbi:G-type lectin S-receptor-like serine/threonine-protein kinase, partial [Mucuna pruriens]
MSKQVILILGILTPNSQFMTLTMDKFLNEMGKEKPISFTEQHLRIATDNYSYLLGSGGFGAVYKGIFSDGTIVAVKVLHGGSNKKIEEQFMAEVGTIGKIHHFNLVRLYGFCFEKTLDSTVGTAKGIAYLHEECQQRIIHYDIKPGNILLDSNFNPKVADFGLAKLCNRENTHITLTKARGTPGYAAPELWMPNFPVTHKCDVYSFGILLFEIIGRRRSLDINRPESQEWFPMWVWKRFEAEEAKELIVTCGIEDENREIAERMIKVALSCVQYRQESRPIMSVVVKMLEGSVEIPKPLNPFPHMIAETNPLPAPETNIDTSTGSDFSLRISNPASHLLLLL